MDGRLPKKFMAISHGTTDDPPLPLDETTLSSDLKIEWEGHSRERLVEPDLIERARPFTVVLEGGPNPGDRISSVQIRHGGETIHLHTIRWEVAPAIKATPSALFVQSSPDATRGTVLLRSQDRIAFRITRVESDIPGLRWEGFDGVAKPTQLVRITLDAGSETPGRWSRLSIRTDHPEQSEVNVPLFIGGPGSAP